MSKPQTARARRLGREETHAEAKLWAALRGSAPGVKVRGRHPIGRFVADFACVERRLVVEVDGAVHERVPEVALRDVERTRELAALGWTVLRLRNEQVIGDMSGAEVIGRAL